MTLSDKLNPNRFTAMSPKFAAMVGFILGEEWTQPVMTSLTITSDGILLTDMGNAIVGDADSFYDNIRRLMVAADLTLDEQVEFVTLLRQRVADWRTS